MRQAWAVVEPATLFVPGWHLDAIADHLEAVTRGEIRNLVINMPPRCAKSLLVAVFWPTWVWIKQPAFRWLFASYASSLSLRDSLKCRRIIDSPWYQEHWGDRYNLSEDQNAKGRFENDKTGYRLATSVGGAVTGEGGDCIVVDDPHNVLEAPSATIRQTALDWWDESMSTRLNNPKTGRKVIVQQRVHEDDLTGHVLKQGGYEILRLPMEYEVGAKQRATSIGWSDPRTEAGELLWPERFGQTEVDNLKIALGSYGAAGQLQQRPSPLGGGMLKIAWFKRYNTPPARFKRIIQSWDTANKAQEINDPWACTTWGETDTDYYLLDCFAKQMEYPEGKRTVKNLAEKWHPSALLIEDKSSGQSLLQDLRLETKLPVIAIEPEGDKITRASVTSPTIEAGKCWLPETAPWLFDFEQEVSAFPNGAHDDRVDSTSQALYWLTHRFLPVRSASW